MKRLANRPGVLLGVFLLSLGLAAFAVWQIDWSRVLPGRSPRVTTTPRFDASVGSEYSYAASDEYETGKLVLYHGLGDAIENAREADILIFGNSRMPLGLREEFLVPRVSALGLRIFSLGGGHSEQARFPLEVIRKHDLRPKVVIVSGGPHIFWDRNRMSELAREAMAMSRFDAAKKWLEVQGGWQLRTRLHRRIPQVAFFGGGLDTKWIIYISSLTGWWHPVREPADRYPIGFAQEHTDYSPVLPFATELKTEFEARGSTLVLTIVPYGDTRIGHLPYLARKLSLPVIIPDFAGLKTADGSHLDRKSAEILTQRFWDDFIARPEIRNKLGLGT